MLNRKGNLDLDEGEELVVRLKTTGSMFVLGGETVRLVGSLKAYHYVPRMHRVLDCGWNNCRWCPKGYRRKVRYETRLLLEKSVNPDSLEEHKAYLSPHEHRLFAKVAEVIEGEGRDPADVRILWRNKPGTKRTVEVVLLDGPWSSGHPRG